MPFNGTELAGCEESGERQRRERSLKMNRVMMRCTEATLAASIAAKNQRATRCRTVVDRSLEDEIEVLAGGFRIPQVKLHCGSGAYGVCDREAALLLVDPKNVAYEKVTVLMGSLGGVDRHADEQVACQRPLVRGEQVELLAERVR